MVFPATALPIRAEMQIDGTWTQVQTSIRGSDAITITGGFAPEQTSITPSAIAFRLSDPDANFVDDNPASPYYGLLPVNTPFRVSVLETAAFLYLPSQINSNPTGATWTPAYAYTADKAGLDVTGDLDLRIDVEPDTWQLGSVGHVLAAKYLTTTTNRSWLWAIQPNGTVRLYWSADGNSAVTNGTYATSTERIPTSTRIALRVTIDVNNGAAGRTITFYTSDSVTGTWTQLGNAVVQSGTTSIFSGTADVQVGAVRNTDGGIPFVVGVDDPLLGVVGRIHRFQMYNGIAGTLVADMNAAAQAEGATSWTDTTATANGWLLNGEAALSLADYRGYGEIASFPSEADVSETDITIAVSVNGIMRRITQGAPILKSAIYRNLSQFIGDGALGYWPLEGGSQTVAAGNAVPGQPAAAVFNVVFSADADIPGSAGVMTLNDTDSSIRGSVTNRTAADQAFCIFYVKVPAAPVGDTELFSFYTTGTLTRVVVTVGAATYRITAYDKTGTSLGTSFTSFGTGAAPGQWLAFQILLTKNGTSVDVDLGWYPLGSSVFFGLSTLTVATATVGAPISFASTAGAATMGVSFTQVMIGNRADWDYSTSAFAQASIAYVGEYALVRYLRVCREEGVEVRVIGWPDDTEPMGPQLPQKLADILDECILTEGGLQYEARDMGALICRSRRSLYAQAASALDFAANHLSGTFRPTSDDQGLRNDVTAQSTSGSFARATRETGPKSVQSPSLGTGGVGRYDTSTTFNPASDLQLPALAGWAVGVGTWPARRVPAIQVNLERAPFVASATLSRMVRSLNPGDRLQVSNTPLRAGGGTTDTLVRGYRETLAAQGFELAFSTVQYGPYDSARYDDANDVVRYDVRTSTLQNDMSTGDTWAYVASSSRKGFWSWKSCPYDVRINGQVNTVLGATRPDVTQNVDSSFENGDPANNGWYVSGGGGTSTLTGSTAVTPPYGTHTALITVSGSPAYLIMRDSYGQDVSDTGTYEIRAWVRCSVARDIKPEVDWYQPDNTPISSTGTPIAVAANTWTEIVQEMIPPSGAGRCGYGVTLDSSPANGTLVYLKNVDMIRKDSRNGRQVLLLSRGVDGISKALGNGAEVHIYPQRAWAR